MRYGGAGLRKLSLNPKVKANDQEQNWKELCLKFTFKSELEPFEREHLQVALSQIHNNG